MGRRGQNGGTQASSSRDMKMFLKNRMWREHWHVIAAVGAIVLALFGSAFLQFSTSQDHVYRLEVTDSVLMERVFRSGEPWVVLCSRPDDELPEVFDKVSTRLAGKSFVGVFDCSQTLPDSGMSVFKRYGIKRSISPTVFTVANGEKPKQVFLNHLQSTKALAKHVKAVTKKTMKQVQNSAQLEARCLSRPNCVLFLRGQRFGAYEKQWIDKLMLEHRTLSFAWMDSTSLKFSLEKMLPDARRGEHRMVLFRRQKDPHTNKKTVLAAKAFRGEVLDAMSVGMFLDENVHSDSLKPLSKSPKILRRKTSEKAKSTKTESSNQRQHKRSHRRKERAEEQSDDHLFPQEVEIDEDADVGSIVFDKVEEDEEVLDLDGDE
ncbi:hypothetical protein PHYBOEH_007894 [Phytophthora boehmeriae]|uniref:Thioredoxin domain-containing protein n=1 Tax=Phytophthora boehmeriae TaxID=109152 RepID=A0A8T1W4K4_9STRA|nr:hypothetical protein PHYBOEH_007894 [Phytophthora boehmeriae]